MEKFHFLASLPPIQSAIWVVAENVRGILSIDAGRTFGRILSDLAKEEDRT